MVSLYTRCNRQYQMQQQTVWIMKQQTVLRGDFLSSSFGTTQFLSFFPFVVVLLMLFVLLLFMPILFLFFFIVQIYFMTPPSPISNGSSLKSSGPTIQDALTKLSWWDWFSKQISTQVYWERELSILLIKAEMYIHLWIGYNINTWYINVYLPFCIIVSWLSRNLAWKSSPWVRVPPLAVHRLMSEVNKLTS